MALENENRIHAALGLSFAPQEMIVRVCRGVLLSTIEQVAPGVIECELVEGLGEGDVAIGTSIEPPPPPFVLALVHRLRLSDRRWRFGIFRADDDLADFGPCGFDVVWFRTASGAGPVIRVA